MPENTEAHEDDASQADPTQDGQPEEEFLNRAARRARGKSGARLDRSAARGAAGPVRAGGGPHAGRQFSNRRTGG